MNVYGTPDGIHGMLQYNKFTKTNRNGKRTDLVKDKSEWVIAVSKKCKGFIESDV